VALVYPYLLQDAPRRVIEAATALCGDRLSDAIRGNWRLGYVVRPSLAERRCRLRENTSAAKGGVWLDLRRYEALDLTVKQTQVALRLLDGKEYSHAQIRSAYSRALHRHGLNRPIAELWREAQRDKSRSEQALLQIVRARVAAYQLVVQHRWNKPKTLQGWKHLEGGFSNAEVARLGDLFGRTIPSDILARRYLLELADAHDLWRITGTKGPLDAWRAEYEEIDPSIRQRVAPHVASAWGHADPALACPPHYWMISGLPHRVQRWTCLRCGEQRDQQARPRARFADRAVSSQARRPAARVSQSI
jgi:hypothetical protein